MFLLDPVRKLNIDTKSISAQERTHVFVFKVQHFLFYLAALFSSLSLTLCLQCSLVSCFFNITSLHQLCAHMALSAIAQAEQIAQREWFDKVKVIRLWYLRMDYLLGMLFLPIAALVTTVLIALRIDNPSSSITITHLFIPSYLIIAMAIPFCVVYAFIHIAVNASLCISCNHYLPVSSIHVNSDYSLLA
jgi:hypothetical protein